MTQGYIIIGTDDYGKTKNITCAYGLCLSLKIADPTREVCVVVNKFSDVPKKYEDVFDYIIELPFGRTDSNHDNIFIDFWQLFYCSPFDETMFINTYSYAISNIESLWNISVFEDIGFLTSRDLQGKESFSWKLEKNKLEQGSTLSTDVVYFNKNELPAEFFKMADPAFKNWRYFYQQFSEIVKCKNFDLTVIVNIVLILVGKEILSRDIFDYTNLMARDSEYQNIDDVEWLRRLNIWIDQELDIIKVNNYTQTGILVYHDYYVFDKFDLRKLHDSYRKKKTKIKE
jgi:hypothetical protein